MPLRNGTYVREMDGAKLLYYSWNTWNDPSVALTRHETGHEFKIVWDDSERAQLYIAMGMSNLEPGEWVEIMGGMVI